MSAPASSPLAILRHDLRTRINHIIGYSELLEEDLTGRGVGDLDDLRKIRRAARELVELVASGLGAETATQQGAAAFQKITEAPGAGATDKRAVVTGRILLVDDELGNREVLARRLERQGHRVEPCDSGELALERLSVEPFDLVLLDVMMPGMDGHTVLERLKGNPALRHVPVIMISALDELEAVVRCIESGAEDFLPKPFNPTLLRARIGATLEKKALRDQERAYLEQIDRAHRRLQGELEEAARYVLSSLPAPLEDPIGVSWSYAPSAELGGDSFGYHWVDEDHFAAYLLDVCGHGVGAALLSVSAINVIRSGSLPHANFLDPGSVLTALNEAFPMEKNNNMYFTLWYGVYEMSTRTLRHASGGHPPPILINPEGAGSPGELLHGSGLLIGVMPGITYQSKVASLPPGARLAVYCDGAYELKRPDGAMLDFEADFVLTVLGGARSASLADDMLAWARRLHGRENLEDDFSFVVIDFPRVAGTGGNCS